MSDLETYKDLLMFDLDAYREMLEKLRRKHLLSRTDLAAEIGISYATLQRLMDKELKTAFSYKTLKKLKRFVEKWEKK